MGKTKKVGSAGRFGVRYGRTIRVRVSAIESKQKSLQKCPFCYAMKVKRLGSGIWQCKKCDIKFIGKAYTSS